MIAMAINIIAGIAVNPSNPDKGVYGIMNAAITTHAVAIVRYFPGALLKNGFLLLITKTINEAETTDSMNHPVLN
jgi:bacterioferritin (cytochrome b1)